MYESFYGLTDKPFQLNPDPSFYFGSCQHRRAMAYLEYGLHQNEGFIVITGEVGAGKTTLVRNLFSQLDAEKIVAAHLVSTQLDADDTLRLVAAAFGIPTKHTEKSQLLLSLEAFLVSVAQEGKRCLLVVDEAQNLTPRAVEELRMLSNFQLDTHALLQSFLIGQPEFRHILQSPHMQQLRQRVIAACHIGPLDAGETRAYIEHRLKHVGWDGNTPRFETGAYEAIFVASGGIPRRINCVCDRLLLSGYLSSQQSFTAEAVNEVAMEISDETFAPKSKVNALNALVAKDNGEDLGITDVDLSQLELDPQLAQEAQQTFESLGCEDLAARLLRVEETISRLEHSMLRLERSMLRVERGNSTSLAFFSRLINSLRPRSDDQCKPA